MKLFRCQSCSSALHFENTRCLACGHRLGYLPGRVAMSAVEPDGDAWRALADPSVDYLFCDNAEEGACNWLVERGSDSTRCLCCRHNRVVPDLSNSVHRDGWIRLELAKHYLFYSLNRWRLPTPDRVADPDSGLAFDFLADEQAADGSRRPVLTGHDNGLITLNIAEANIVERETRRMAMGEPYRTLLGHFRHEIGHYYWDRLVRDGTGDELDRCRSLFGDDSTDYGAALAHHYEAGAPADWNDTFISSYASAHPWEDFAETWAHYTHMVDALETAQSYGLVIQSQVALSQAIEAEVDFDAYTTGGIDDLLGAWLPITVALNSLSRCMGQPDLYPFAMPQAIVAKLAFIHTLVRNAPQAVA